MRVVTPTCFDHPLLTPHAIQVRGSAPPVSDGMWEPLSDGRWEPVSDGRWEPVTDGRWELRWDGEASRVSSASQGPLYLRSNIQTILHDLSCVVHALMSATAWDWTSWGWRRSRRRRRCPGRAPAVATRTWRSI